MYSQCEGGNAGARIQVLSLWANTHKASDERNSEHQHAPLDIEDDAYPTISGSSLPYDAQNGVGVT